ncbi:phage holin family protein [Demequina sp. B12]|uniref:phage holin family protein n=1 Tax=Demequina sp. B12 TaxID=2992757 RepID=UPI00237A9594|nr:phage holin family protein [Demequina sp. B12]MDE0571927.1 phage holin family protein [Demequina sp. B12]
MPGSGFAKTLLNSILGAIAGQWIATIKAETEVMKIEFKVKSRELGKGAALLAVTAVLGFFLVFTLLVAAIAGLSTIWPVWLSALVVGGGMLFFMLIFGLVGARKIKKNKDLVPTASIERIKNSF